MLVWQKAHELVLATYKLSEKLPRHEIFGLISQIRRAAVSIAANIVEGFRRRTLKDSLSFYHIADASLEELKYHLLLSRDLKYISDDDYHKIMGLSEEAGSLLTRWIQSQAKFL